ncbi:C40 family peptidase [Streptomyces cellostaticus]|uniref:C40 family peptidase n=1 Tax=Streptomyces cellostaticus TaxID=67285 RepID=UPI0020267039|nr:C40 family peptidase [Streptomyces cellostaticus]
MASHRKPGPPGTRGTDIRTPVLATAALTSVAVLSQTAGAASAPASATGDGRPSAEEIEKKIDELYRRADPEEETAAAPRSRAEAPPGETLRRPGLFTKAREGLAPFTAAPETAGSLLAEYPEDHFTQNRLMNRLASRVRGTAERGRSPRAPEEPAAARYDVKSAKTAVQHKLATSRELLSRLTAPAAEPARAQAPAPVRAPDPDPDPAPVPAPPSAEAAPSVAAPVPAPAPAVASPPAPAPAPERQPSSAVPVSVPSVVPPVPVTKAEKAIAFARAQIGKPYVSGASGPGSYDCAGLTQAAWKAAGVTLPRTARDQAAMGTAVPLTDARPGDLVFFHEDSSHVGLCTGDGTMIHAPRPGAYVREEPVHLAGESVVHRVVRPA